MGQRVGKAWGLVEWVTHSMKKWQASILLIEGKASGLTVHQELRRLHFDENWSVQLVNPKGDKVVRALAAQPTFGRDSFTPRSKTGPKWSLTKWKFSQRADLTI
jgi:phage terminase large subunit-like protein